MAPSIISPLTDFGMLKELDIDFAQPIKQLPHSIQKATLYLRTEAQLIDFDIHTIVPNHEMNSSKPIEIVMVCDSDWGFPIASRPAPTTFPQCLCALMVTRIIWKKMVIIALHSPSDGAPII